MAWTAPRTWTLSESVTAALLNTHLRDNLTVLRGMQGYATLVYKTAVQSIPNASWTIVTWDAALWTVGSGMSAAFPNSTLIAPIAGWWELHLSFEFAANVNGTREWKHAVALYCERATAANTHRGGAHDTIQMGLNATVQLNTYQGAGVALNLLGGANATSTRAAWRFVGEA